MIRQFMSARTIKNISKVVIGDQNEARLPISQATKRAVYARAKKRCECCGMPLKMNQGQFHHHRTPKIKPTPKTVQFLCATDHQNYGHEKKTRTIRVGFVTRKETYIVRKKVRKRKSPYWEQIESTKKTIKTRSGKATKKHTQSRKTTKEVKVPTKKRKRNNKTLSPLEKFADKVQKDFSL